MQLHLSRDDEGVHLSVETSREEREMTIRVLEEKAAKYEATLRAIAHAPTGDPNYMRKLASDAVTPPMLSRAFASLR